MKVRKSLTLSGEADWTLKEKEIAAEEKKAQSEIIEELIMGRVKEINRKKKLRALRELKYTFWTTRTEG